MKKRRYCKVKKEMKGNEKTDVKNLGGEKQKKMRIKEEKENGSETRTRTYAIAGIVAIAIALLTAMMVMPASATTVTIAPSDADAWLAQDPANVNFGTRDYFRVRSYAGNNYRSLVHFDLSSLPAGVTIESTILYLHKTNIIGDDRTHNAHRVTADWTETGVTWNNQPSYDSTATDSVSTGSAYETWVEWNVTSDVQLFVDGTQNYGWLIKDAVEDIGFPPRGWDYYSREKGDYRRPKLEVTYTEGGEPDLEYGDAPDPIYPSLLASDGARHNAIDTEWLGLQTTGDWKDFEPDAKVPDLDIPFDDGLLTPTITTGNPAQTVTFEVTELTGSPTLIANILIDLNIDGDWADAGEHVVANQPIAIVGGEGMVVSNPFSTVGAIPGPTWMRITLTRSPINPGWDGTMTGYAQMIPFECGETEDWEIYIEEEVQEPDLIVTDINAYHYNTNTPPWFNMLNEIDVTVKNNGSAAAGASNVCLYIDDTLFGNLPVSSLDVDEEETVTFTGWNPSGDDCLQQPCTYAESFQDYDVKAVADCDGDVAESDEENNERTVVERACYNGYMADEPLENVAHGKVHGHMIYTTGDGTYGGLYNVGDSRDTHYDITIPVGASVEYANLNVYYTWYYEKESCPQMKVSITDPTDTTHILTLEKAYNDLKCFCPGAMWVFPWGNYVYDLTAYIQDSGTYTVTVERTGGKSFCIAAPGIVLIYNDENAPLIEYWVNKGADVLIGGRRSDGGSLAWQECINNATFPASITTDEVVTTATLGVVSPWGGSSWAPGMTNYLFFNDVKLGTGVYHGYGETYYESVDSMTMEIGSGNAQVGVAVTDVTELYLAGSDNVVGQADDGDNMMPANAFLVVAYPPPPEIPVYIDVKPGSCPNPLNLKSKGVLPVAVLGTAEFDVTTIDPGTILLTREGCEGVAAIRWSYEDVATPFTGELCDCNDLNGDGYIDLTLKFDTQELVSNLELDKVAGETIPLTVTGNLNAENGGTPIEGKDCIRVQ